jgi:hypothetical protein
LLWNTEHDPAKVDDSSLYEHYDLRHRDPLEYFERGQIFTSFESDDPGPAYLPVGMEKSANISLASPATTDTGMASSKTV